MKEMRSLSLSGIHEMGKGEVVGGREDSRSTEELKDRRAKEGLDQRSSNVVSSISCTAPGCICCCLKGPCKGMIHIRNACTDGSVEGRAS